MAKCAYKYHHEGSKLVNVVEKTATAEIVNESLSETEALKEVTEGGNGGELEVVKGYGKALSGKSE